MGAVRLLWIDGCAQSAFRGLFQLLPSRYHAIRVDRFENFADAVRQHHPELVCIEFDYPDRPRLQAVTVLAGTFPELPLLMFTEYHSEALAVWAFRSGVRDYRVKPVSRQTLLRIIETLLAIEGSRGQAPRPVTWLPADLIEPAGHLQRSPSTSYKTGVAVAYIARHFAKNLRRDALAHLSHLSVSEFSRVFRREQGATFQHFLLAYRVAKARDFLAEPHMKVEQAAYLAGFSDASYFSRLFRRLTGMTPSKYQEWARLSAPRSRGSR